MPPPLCSLGLGEVNHERESAGVRRRGGDTTSRWKDVQDIESYCVGRFFSVKKSCSGERAFQLCVAKTENLMFLKKYRLRRVSVVPVTIEDVGHL